VSFDGSTTVSEFLVSLEKSIGVRESSVSGFALFSDDPTSTGVEHYLQTDAKVICAGCTACLCTLTVHVKHSACE